MITWQLDHDSQRVWMLFAEAVVNVIGDRMTTFQLLPCWIHLGVDWIYIRQSSEIVYVTLPDPPDHDPPVLLACDPLDMLNRTEVRVPFLVPSFSFPQFLTPNSAASFQYP